MSVLIIDAPLLGIAQNLIRLGSFLKFVFSFLIPGVAVLKTYFPVSATSLKIFLDSEAVDVHAAAPSEDRICATT